MDLSSMRAAGDAPYAGPRDPGKRIRFLHSVLQEREKVSPSRGKPHDSSTKSSGIFGHDPANSTRSFILARKPRQPSNDCSTRPSDRHAGTDRNPVAKRARKQACPRKRLCQGRVDTPLPAVEADYTASELLRKMCDVMTSRHDATGRVSGAVRKLRARDSVPRDATFAAEPSSPRPQDSIALETPLQGDSPEASLHCASGPPSREKRKELRLFGKEYTSPSGRIYPERRVREKDCSKCRYNCSQNVSPAQRLAIFTHFWRLDSYVKRLHYYCHSIREKPAKTMTHTRECSREYTFLVDGKRVRVCKGFYLATLDVSDKAVRIAMEKRKQGRAVWDKRGPQQHGATCKLRDTCRPCQHAGTALFTAALGCDCDCD